MKSNKNIFRFFKFFLHKYLLGAVILTFLITFVMYKIGKTNFISAREALSVSLAKRMGSEFYNNSLKVFSESLEEFDWQKPDNIAQLDKIVKTNTEHFDVLKLNIINRAKRIVYSTDSNNIGSLQNNQKLVKSFEGAQVSSLILNSEKLDTENALLESFIPFRVSDDNFDGGNEIIGVFVIYQGAATLNQQILTLRNTIFVAAFAMLVLVILCFRYVVARADQTQMKLRREIENYAENLEQMVTDRTKELSEEKIKLQVILNHVPSAFVLVDKNFRIKSASTALREFTDKSLEEVENQHCYQVICNKKPSGICPTTKALKSNHVENRILTLKQKDGKERCLEHVAVPISNNGKIESILEIFTDITEKKKMQDLIIQAERVSAMGQIAATISHEIRNGLTSVKLILQHLAVSLSQDKKKAANVALQSINDMENVVRQLLDFARPTPISFKTTDINKLLKHSMDFCKQQLELKYLKLQEDYGDNIPKRRLDAEHIRQAVINLILNAIQASKENETLGIKTTVSPLEMNMSDYFIEKKASIHLKKNQRVVKIDISDKGCGIPPENLNRIFDPFFTTKIDGSGLGLPVTQRTVHEHGGIITVNSKPGLGSTFTIILPV